MIGTCSRPGKTAHGLALGLAEQTRQQIRFAVAQPQTRGDLPRDEAGNRRPGDHDVTATGAVLHDQVHDDVALEGDARRDVDVDADRPVVERRQRVEVRSAGRDRRERGRGHRNFLTECQRQLRALGPAELWLRDDLGFAVGGEEAHHRLRHGQIEVGGTDAAADRVGVERAATSSAPGGCRPGVAAGACTTGRDGAAARDRLRERTCRRSSSVPRSRPNCLARRRFTSRICTSITTSARGLSFASINRSMMSTIVVVPRTVIVFELFVAAICGGTCCPPRRATWFSSWTSSPESA